MLTDITKRNINFDLEEQGKETSKLGYQGRKLRIRWATESFRSTPRRIYFRWCDVFAASNIPFSGVAGRGLGVVSEAGGGGGRGLVPEKFFVFPLQNNGFF